MPKIRRLVLMSGSGNSILRSIRPGRISAGSSDSILFVAMITCSTKSGCTKEGNVQGTVEGARGKSGYRFSKLNVLDVVQKHRLTTHRRFNKTDEDYVHGDTNSMQRASHVFDSHSHVKSTTYYRTALRAATVGPPLPCHIMGDERLTQSSLLVKSTDTMFPLERVS